MLQIKPTCFKRSRASGVIRTPRIYLDRDLNKKQAQVYFVTLTWVCVGIVSKSQSQNIDVCG